jgi:IclR family KDG regulon transcriptional repressor
MPRIVGEASGDGVQAVVLALRILEYLAEQGKAVGVTALAQALGTTKSRIYRHLRTLVQQGYIQQAADTDRYRVGTRLLTLGLSVAENFDLTKAAHGIIRELRDALGHSCVVSQVEAAGVRVLATIPGKSAIEIGVKPGSLLHFHSSAQGKIALAFGSDQLRAEVIGPNLEMMTPQTIVNPEALKKEIQRVRARGWAIAPNEAVTGLNTLAAPIFDASGDLIGTVGVVDSIQFVSEHPSDEQIRRIVAAGQAISHALGYSVHH